jgi:hypothetical protein
MTSTMLHERIALRKLVWVWPLTVVITIIVDLLIRSLAVAFFGVAETFQSFQPATIISGIIVYLLLALLAFVLVSRFARQPLRFYCWLALVALCVSFLTPVMALLGLLPAPGMNLHIFWTMIVMHIVSAAIAVSVLTTLTRE